jgi:hypothetical protein
MAKKLITYMLLLIISIQLFPIKELSLTFSPNNLYEDLEEFSAEKKDTEKSEDEFKEKKIEWLGSSYLESLMFFQFKKKIHVILNIVFFSRNLDDIPTPPPLSGF